MKKSTTAQRKLTLQRTTIESLSGIVGGIDSTASPCGPTKWQCPSMGTCGGSFMTRCETETATGPTP